MQLITWLRKLIFLHGQVSGTQFPAILKTIEYSTFTENTYFTNGNEIFDIAEKKTKDYYSFNNIK